MQLRAFHVGLALVVLATTTSCTTRTTPANPLQGAWSVTAIEPGDGSALIDPAQPGLYIFGRDHYSAVYAPGAAPRVSSAAAFAPDYRGNSRTVRKHYRQRWDLRNQCLPRSLSAQ